MTKSSIQFDVLPSASDALTVAMNWEKLPGERRMVADLLRWLLSARWIGSASRVAFEVPWRGRRIDLVTINGKGHLSAFEFKLGGTKRVFEQALYNSVSVHRSFVVSGNRPREQYRRLAQAQGIGVFVVNGTTKLLERASVGAPRAELAGALRKRALLAGPNDV